MKTMILTAALLCGAIIANSQDMDNLNTNTSLAPAQSLELTSQWDKVFPKSDKVDHLKVTFVNRYGITLAAHRERRLALRSVRPDRHNSIR